MFSFQNVKFNSKPKLSVYYGVTIQLFFKEFWLYTGKNLDFKDLFGKQWLYLARFQFICIHS